MQMNLAVWLALLNSSVCCCLPSPWGDGRQALITSLLPPRSPWVDALNTSLPPPRSPWVDALNTRYLLRWSWSHMENTTFCTQYTFSHQRSDDSSFTSACVGPVNSCDLSAFLDYDACYLIRVRAQGRGQRSNWISLPFCPDKAKLGPPTHVTLEAGVGMVTLTFEEPMTEQGTPMSSLLTGMRFRLRYWRAHSPHTLTEEDIDQTHYTVHVRPHTEYCLQLTAFNRAFNKTSRHTHTQCVTTLGSSPVWLALLGMLGAVVVAAVLLYLGYRKMKLLFRHYPIPQSLMHTQYPPTYLLEPQDDSCVLTAVVAVATEVRRVWEGSGPPADKEDSEDSGTGQVHAGRDQVAQMSPPAADHSSSSVVVAL